MNEHNSELLVPFIGAFSSGKSSLINALLGEALLSTDITPETALPIELRAGSQRIFNACWPDGRREAIPEPQFLSADFAELANADGWIEAEISHLQDWPKLVLVDLPGWSSGESTHERHVDEYLFRLSQSHLDKNTLFVLVIGADEGTLRDNVRERLQQIDLGGASYLLVLSKADKRTPNDQQTVLEHLREAVTATMGKPPRQVLLTSARKQEVEGLRLAIDEVRKTLLPKAPPIDTLVLARSIDRHIERLKEAAQERSEIASSITDDVWDKLDDRYLDREFDSVEYYAAKLQGEFLAWSIQEEYERVYTRNMNSNFPAPDQKLLEMLTALELKAPDPAITLESSDLLLSRAKKHIKLAIQKSEPGFLASSSPDAVGARIRSRIRDKRSEIRNDISACARTGLTTWKDNQISEWERLRQLASS